MFISIVENQSGAQELLRRLAPNESLDVEMYCHRWASENDVTIAKSNGYIPNGCADFYAEIRRTKEANSACWASFNFYLEYPE